MLIRRGKRVDGYWEPAVVLCACGEEVELHNPLENVCECGRTYSSTGQEVMPRSQWEGEDRLAYVPDFNNDSFGGLP